MRKKPPMNKQIKAMIAIKGVILGAVAVIAIGQAIAQAEERQERVTMATQLMDRDYWSLVRWDAAGNAYVVDYDLSWEDCLMAMEKADPTVAWSCDRQPSDQPIGGKEARRQGR